MFASRRVGVIALMLSISLRINVQCAAAFLCVADAFRHRHCEHRLAFEHTPRPPWHAVGLQEQAVLFVGTKMRAGKTHGGSTGYAAIHAAALTKIKWVQTIWLERQRAAWRTGTAP